MEGDSRSSTISPVAPLDPSVDGDVDTQVLIKEARARARRRRMRLALAVICLLVVTVSVVGAVRRPSGNVVTARRDGSRPTAIAPAAAPRFFADTQGSGEGNGPLEIRQTATGKLVWREQGAASSDSLTGLAATGASGFVVARTVGACATRLYRVRLSARGLPGTPAPFGPTLPGQLWSLAAGDGGRVIGYAISGCSKGAPGYLGVLQVSSGRTREWGGISLGGMSSGNLALQGQLTMSANGRSLAFVADSMSRRYGLITGQGVRVLATDAAPGPVARSSRVVYRHAAPGAKSGSSLTAASLSPGGTSVYVCRQSATRTLATAEIVAYGTGTGSPRRVVATFTAKGTWPQVSCSSMALDSSGGFLLVPYALHHLGQPGTEVVQRVARISLATLARSTVPVRMPASGGISEEDGTSIVAW